MRGVKPQKESFIMAMQIVNLKRKNGEYEGRKYDNFNITTVDYESINSALVFGPDVDELKIKADVFLSELDRNIGALASPDVKEAKDIEGLFIAPFYNKYGQVIGFNLFMPPTQEAAAPADGKKAK